MSVSHCRCNDDLKARFLIAHEKRRHYTSIVIEAKLLRVVGVVGWRFLLVDLGKETRPESGFPYVLFSPVRAFLAVAFWAVTLFIAFWAVERFIHRISYSRSRLSRSPGSNSDPSSIQLEILPPPGLGFFGAEQRETSVTRAEGEGEGGWSRRSLCLRKLCRFSEKA